MPGLQVRHEFLAPRFHPARREVRHQRFVARPGLVHVELADDLAEFLGRLDHGDDMGPALVAVAVEQRFVEAAAPDMHQLPGEVGGVADAGAQALAEEGRRLVHRVAGEDHPPLAPFPPDPRGEAVGRAAPDLHGVDIDQVGEDVRAPAPDPRTRPPSRPA